MTASLCLGLRRSISPYISINISFQVLFLKNEYGNKFAPGETYYDRQDAGEKHLDNLYYRSAGNKATPNIFAVEGKSYIIISRVLIVGNIKFSREEELNAGDQ